MNIRENFGNIRQYSTILEQEYHMAAEAKAAAEYAAKQAQENRQNTEKDIADLTSRIGKINTDRGYDMAQDFGDHMSNYANDVRYQYSEAAGAVRSAPRSKVSVSSPGESYREDDGDLKDFVGTRYDATNMRGQFVGDRVYPAISRGLRALGLDSEQIKRHMRSPAFRQEGFTADERRLISLGYYNTSESESL